MVHNEIQYQFIYEYLQKWLEDNHIEQEKFEEPAPEIAAPAPPKRSKRPPPMLF